MTSDFKSPLLIVLISSSSSGLYSAVWLGNGAIVAAILGYAELSNSHFSNGVVLGVAEAFCILDDLPQCGVRYARF